MKISGLLPLCASGSAGSLRLAALWSWPATFAFLSSAGLLLSCGEPARPPHYRADVSDAGNGDASLDLDSGSKVPPAADAGGYCGNLVIPTRTTTTNLYFVVDRSGSMTDPLPGSSLSKFESAHRAISNLLRVVGHRVNYGATVFPARVDPDPFTGQLSDQAYCRSGEEIWSTQPGDPSTFVAAGRIGPKLTSFAAELRNAGTSGGTPTASTLAALVPALSQLPGTTYVILATDGEPNCNASARCGSENCYFNYLLRQNPTSIPVVNGVVCSANVNCCDPAVLPDGPLSCVDGANSVAAAKALSDANIKTFVIGMPGSEYFADILDSVAEAGQTGDVGAAHRYFAVTNADQLTTTLLRIGTGVSISCSLPLQEAPPDPTLVNVYLDQKALPSGEANGWVWTGSSSIEIKGAACASLMAGDIFQIQVVAGCPTQIE